VAPSYPAVPLPCPARCLAAGPGWSGFGRLLPCSKPTSPASHWAPCS
jgi:hypothetical protein